MIEKWKKLQATFYALAHVRSAYGRMEKLPLAIGYVVAFFSVYATSLDFFHTVFWVIIAPIVVGLILTPIWIIFFVFDRFGEQLIQERNQITTPKKRKWAKK